ncbi:hypothetical protein SAMN04488540_108122 [Ferrimonas sediminum]|uniref:Phosphate-selective porin O and P n=1 Tax=Ferrimonas sediminum TaxID=718193 RepID=A0A1G8TXV5_9GAMM|nr:hypothetical protein [Ferrimonas sediminum]SDJ46426.1 hypothetical protein SAMN04488540_108122 [Ferrimonas sediminum]
MNKYKTIALIVASTLFTTNSLAADNYEFGGMTRVNYSYVDYIEASKDKLGDFKFEVAAISFNGERDDIGLSMEYRFRDDFDAIKHGYAYYKLNDDTTLKAGVTKVPFGNIGFISNSFWLSLQYYVGFEDDYDTGFALEYKGDGYQTDLAFFKGAENSASSTKRFAADQYQGQVNGTDYNYEETNQINLRHSIFTDVLGIDSTIGASLEYGQMYDASNGSKENRYAYAVHYEGAIDNWKVQAQYLKYDFDVATEYQNKVALSLVGASYEIASEASAFTFNLARKADMGWGVMTVYNDFSALCPESEEFDNSYQNVTGMSVGKGPVFAWFDFIVGKNMLWSSRSNHVGLSDQFDKWDKRVNINLGYYF